jgi:predicted dehydrogenase
MSTLDLDLAASVWQQFVAEQALSRENPADLTPVLDAGVEAVATIAAIVCREWQMAQARQRYAVVGTGARAEMFVRAIVSDHPDSAELVAFADPNQARMAAHNRWLAELGHPAVATYDVEAFETMLDRERVDIVIVTSIDVTHDRYIVAALKRGRGVITEKPMTTDATRCARILRADAAARAVGHAGAAVTFNYRYNPLHERVRELLADGVVGRIGSVHFEWLLDLRHGADYFRRWHRDKANSGGLLVHKAGHHFDLVNWWIGATPVRVYAEGRLFLYGPAGAEHGYDRGYARAHGDPAAADDPFALALADNPRLRELYLEAEGEDGYLRDRNVFADGVSIEDDMSVVVRYSSGATMTYHLHAYAPWEGYRLMVNGSAGRLELEVVESDHVSPQLARGVKGGTRSSVEAVSARTVALQGVEAAAEGGHVRLTVHPFWRRPYDATPAGLVREGHGGADARMTGALFAGAAALPDPLGRSATARDGALALLTGLAANESLATGRPVEVADLVDPHLLSPDAHPVPA